MPNKKKRYAMSMDPRRCVGCNDRQQHQRCHLVGPVVAIHSEHQDAANQALNRLLQNVGRLMGRRAVVSGSGILAGVHSLEAAEAADGVEVERPAPLGTNRASSKCGPVSSLWAPSRYPPWGP